MQKLSSLFAGTLVLGVLACISQGCATAADDGTLPFGAGQGGGVGGFVAGGAGQGTGNTGTGNTGNVSGGGHPNGGGQNFGGGVGTGSVTGSGGGSSTCRPSYCPSSGTGTPCCTSSGSCGVDFGMGCAAAPQDGGSGSGGYRGSGGSVGSGGFVGNGGSQSGGATGSGGATSTGGATGAGGGPPPPDLDGSVPPGP